MRYRQLPTNEVGELTPEGEELIRSAVEAERSRPIRPKRPRVAATEIGKHLQGQMGASATLVDRTVDQFATGLIDKTPSTGRKQ